MSKNFSSAERKSFFKGLFVGMSKSKKKTTSKSIVTRSSNSSKKNSPKRKKWYSFLAFNDNCDVFNVEVYDSSRNNALKQARSKLKRDPEMPCWGVTVTEDAGNRKEYYRTVTVDNNAKGGVFDNWKSHYSNRDDAVRQKYGKDLSKPLK